MRYLRRNRHLRARRYAGIGWLRWQWSIRSMIGMFRLFDGVETSGESVYPAGSGTSLSIQGACRERWLALEAEAHPPFP
jgi:hypothetical protein